MPQPKLSLIQGSKSTLDNEALVVNNAVLKYRSSEQTVRELDFSTQESLELSNKLYQYLELDRLISQYQHEIRKTIAIDDLIYKHPGDNSRVENKGRHYLSYNLVFDNQALGEVFFIRRRRFVDEEAQYLEKTLIALLLPLFNARKYHKAIMEAQTDPLTGALNRLGLDKNFEREINLARRNKSDLSLLVLDVDHFKKVNDTYGHDFGDKILKQMAAHIKSCIRATDVFARFGGEEFVVLLNNTSRSGALLLAERIRQQIEETPEKYNDIEVNYTVSIGVATLREDDDRERFFKRADNALYEAKHKGRNRVVLGQS